MTSTRNLLGLIFLIVSLVFYVFGVTLPFMSLKIHVEMPSVPFVGSLFQSSNKDVDKEIVYTIFQAIRSLIENKQVFVAFLLGFFGVFLPLLKLLLTGVMVIFYRRDFARRLQSMVHVIGKFAMADVFTVGIFVAFFYTQTNQMLRADIRPGYYFFVGYCLFSIFSNMLISLPKTSAEVNQR